ncbi:hypothetical protein ACFPRL_06630 [Pseudoclavibacter helvolus]
MPEGVIVDQGVVAVIDSLRVHIGGRFVVVVPVGERGAGGLVAVVVAAQMLDCGVGAVAVDEVEHLPGLVALQEDDRHPLPLRGLPGDAAQVPGCLIEDALGGADVPCGLLECVGSGPGVGSPEITVTVIVGGAALVGEAGSAELDERLLQGAGRAEEFPDDAVEVVGVVDTDGGVCETAQRLAGFLGVGGRVVERGHVGPPGGSVVMVSRCAWRLRPCGTAVARRR